MKVKEVMTTDIICIDKDVELKHVLNLMKKHNITKIPVVEEKKLALVIGNGNYIHSGYLANPENDARAMAKALENLDFDVMKYENATLVEMKKAIEKLADDQLVNMSTVIRQAVDKYLKEHDIDWRKDDTE